MHSQEKRLPKYGKNHDYGLGSSFELDKFESQGQSLWSDFSNASSFSTFGQFYPTVNINAEPQTTQNDTLLKENCLVLTQKHVLWIFKASLSDQTFWIIPSSCLIFLISSVWNHKAIWKNIYLLVTFPPELNDDKIFSQCFPSEPAFFGIWSLPEIHWSLLLINFNIYIYMNKSNT